ncbi:MAG: hypothetical protein PHH83_04055 [Patescibacteria group bacterium]|nr:hypothetical protein [Patescibacteria group bacterium]
MLLIVNLDFSINKENHFLKNHNCPPSPWIVNRIKNSISGYGPSRTYNLFIKYNNYEPKFIGGEPVTDWTECPKFVIDPMPVKLILPGEEKSNFFSLRSTTSEVDILMFLAVLSESGNHKFHIDTRNAEIVLKKFDRDRISVSGHTLVKMERTGFVDVTFRNICKRIHLNRIEIINF